MITEEKLEETDGTFRVSAVLSPHDSPCINQILQPVKVLFAEDSNFNFRITAISLSRYGFLIDSAINGEEALRKYRENYYDCILMDYDMPEMDGLQATLAIRQAESQTGQHIPIIGYSASMDRTRGIAAGMNDFVSKPATPADLAEAIMSWLPGGINGAKVLKRIC